MIFKQLINSVDINQVYEILSTLRGAEYTIDEAKQAYTEIVEKTSDATPESTKFYIELSMVRDDIEPYDEYVMVSLINKEYIEPPANCKPWGGADHPEGYYNVNLDKYNKRFSLAIRWNELGNCEVVNNTQLSNAEVIAEVLWEATFYGFSEEKRDAFFNDIKEKVDNIKAGKDDYLLKYDSVEEMIEDIQNKIETGAIEEFLVDEDNDNE